MPGQILMGNCIKDFIKMNTITPPKKSKYKDLYEMY